MDEFSTSGYNTLFQLLKGYLQTSKIGFLIWIVLMGLKKKHFQNVLSFLKLY